MSGLIHITIPGEPVTWKRARRGEHSSYTDPAQAAHVEKVRADVRQAGFRGPSLAVPFRLTCRFYRDMNPWDLRFGDKDNLEKLIMDALRGVVWADDQWVIGGGSDKLRDIWPRTELTIEWLPSVAQQTPADFKAVLGPKPLAKLNRRRLQPSVRRNGP